MDKRKFKQQRIERLKKPANIEKSQHGQGVYLTEASKNRSRIMQTLWKGRLGHTHWVRLYMMDAMPTRQWQEQHPQQE